MKKKLFILGLSLLGVVSLASCGESNDDVDPSTLTPEVSISGVDRIEVGGQTLLSLSLTNSTGSYVWESQNLDIATVDNGLVTGLSVGVATIKATNTENINISATYEVAVVENLDNQYSVEFRNYDGTLLYETYVDEGEEAVYKGSEPTRLNTDSVMYEFLRWDTDLTSIFEDTVTYAVYSESDFSDFYFEDLGTTYKLVGYSGTATYMKTPTSFNGRPVTAIGSYIIQNNETLETLVVSEGIYSIDQYAFAQAAALKSATLPGSCYSYGNNVFYRCYELEDVTLSEGMTEVPAYMFNQCTALKTIEYPSTITTIGEYAFFMSGVEEVVVPDTVTQIDYGAFNSCTSLKSVVIEGENEITFGTAVFAYNTSLETYTFNGTYGNNEIAQTMFSGCTALTSFVMPNSVTSVLSYAFQNTSSMTSLKLSSNLTSIGTNAFSNCAAFSYDSQLNSYPGLIFEEDSAISIDNHLLLIPASTGNGKRAMMKMDGFSATEIDLVAMNVTEIGDNLFYNYRALTKVTLSDNITYYGDYCFAYAGASTGITVNDGDTELTFGPNVEYIGSYAFQMSNATNNLSSLLINKVTINTDLGGTKTIVERTFQNCYALEKFEISTTCGITTIETGGVGWCNYLTQAFLPKSITYLGNYAFQNTITTTYLTIYYEGTEEEWAAITQGGSTVYQSSRTGIEYEQTGLPEE